MDLDLSNVYSLQRSLNLWMVVLLGSISGLLAFALTNALRVIIARHRRHAAFSPAHPVVRRIVATLILASTLGLLLLASNFLVGRVEVDGRGLLFGSDLFAVMRRPGFLPSYAGSGEAVRKGEPLVFLRRDAAPDEIAAAQNRRDILRQEFEFVQSGPQDLDPLIVREYTLAEDVLKDLENRRQKLLDTRDTLVREAPHEKVENEGRLQALEKDLQAVQHEIDQTQASFETADKLFESAKLVMAQGLVPQDEFERRRERVSVLRSRRDQLQGRRELLIRERSQLATLTSSAEGTYSAQLAARDRELSGLSRRLELAREGVDQARRRLEDDRLRAGKQRDNRLQQIQIQIGELDTLLNASHPSLSARAPWDGVVGFRDPSPASVRSDTRPLMVLYQPGKVFVRMQVPDTQARIAVGQKLDIRLRALMPESVNTTFGGELVDRAVLEDSTVELRIACHPPQPAVRELALGNAVPVSVVVRRRDLLTTLGIRWYSALAAVFLLSVALGEIWVQCRARSASHETRDRYILPWLRVNWGGDPEEFMEFVAGVGIVSRSPQPRRRTAATPWTPANSHTAAHRDAVPLEAGADTRVRGDPMIS